MLVRSHAEQDALYAKLKAKSLWLGPNLPEVVILSAELAHAERSENDQRTRDLEEDLQRKFLPYKRVLGSYLGRTERSFVVTLPGGEAGNAVRLSTLKQLAAKYGQESILHLDRYRQAVLIYGDGREVEHIGRFRPVSEDLAKATHSWTYDVEQDQYFIVE